MDKRAQYVRNVSPFLRKRAGFMDMLHSGLRNAGEYFQNNPNAFGYLWKIPGAYLLSRLFGARRRTAYGLAALAGLQNYLYGWDSSSDIDRGGRFGRWLSGKADKLGDKLTNDELEANVANSGREEALGAAANMVPEKQPDPDAEDMGDPGRLAEQSGKTPDSRAGGADGQMNKLPWDKAVAGAAKRLYGKAENKVKSLWKPEAPYDFGAGGPDNLGKVSD